MDAFARDIQMCEYACNLESLNVRKIVEIVKMVIHYHVLRGYLYFRIFDDIEMCENVLGVFDKCKE